MSASIDRIIATVGAKCRIAGSTPPDDWDSCDTLAFGDWKGAINIELKAIKKEIERVADGLEKRHDSDHDLAIAAVLRFAVKDL